MVVDFIEQIRAEFARIGSPLPEINPLPEGRIEIRAANRRWEGRTPDLLWLLDRTPSAIADPLWDRLDNASGFAKRKAQLESVIDGLTCTVQSGGLVDLAVVGGGRATIAIRELVAVSLNKAVAVVKAALEKGNQGGFLP